MKKYLHTFIIVACVTFFSACTDRPAIIQGEIPDTAMNPYRVDQSLFDDSPFNHLVSNYPFPVKDGIWEVEFDGSSPRVETFYPGYNLSLSQIVFITPGDRVSFKVVFLPEGDHRKNGATCYLEFSGKNAAHYNFFTALHKALSGSNFPFYSRINDLVQYKQAQIKWRDDQLAFLEQYCKDNKVSKDFKKYAESYIINSHISGMLPQPFESYGVPLSEMPADYLDVDETLLKENFMNAFGQTLMNKYVKFYAPDPYGRFDEIYENINGSVTGYSRDYLAAGMIGFFAAHQTQNYRESLLAAIEKESARIVDPGLLEYIAKAREYYLTVNQPIPDSVLSTTYVKSYDADQPVALAELLKEREGKVIYMDFWASWCIPCREDIAAAAEAKRFLKDKGVEWIYISVDSDEASWRKVAETDGITHNQYLVMDGTESALCKYFEIAEIPRYIILDKEHLVTTSKAPRPNYVDVENLKREINDCFKVEVFF